MIYIDYFMVDECVRFLLMSCERFTNERVCQGSYTFHLKFHDFSMTSHDHVFQNP